MNPCVYKEEKLKLSKDYGFLYITEIVFFDGIHLAITSILLTAKEKMNSAKNYQYINARGDAVDIKPVIHGILYFFPRSVYYFSHTFYGQ